MLYTYYIWTERAARMQKQHRLSTDVGGPQTKAWLSCEKVLVFVLFPLFKIIKTLTCRSTVQMLLSLLDPEGVKRQRGHRLRRRVYQNKASDMALYNYSTV